MPGAEWAWLLPALSFAAFLLIVLLGRFLPSKGAFIAIAAITAGFGIFWLVLRDLLLGGSSAFSITWFEVGQRTFMLGMVLDPLAVIMLGIVSFVALLVQVYSLGYMKGDPRFGWYFAVHALFVASMLSLVLADNFLLLYFAWELVGACSYLLIGFWYERRSAAEAAKKAFITTRLGDVGLLIGILILFKATGTFNMTEIFAAVEAGTIAAGTLTAAAILIFLGAMGKSAQFPLHVWLPDAMEGPTPVSALIHAATMVAAGVYLVSRAFPLFLASPTALLVVAIIGLITVLIAGTMALVMTDLKRVLAYSTISHLGFMMLALGAGGLTAGMFHLLSHAFAKAMLFLGAGVIMHETGKTDIRQMGGLAKKMPITAFTFIIGALALAGLPPLSGFFSKDEILLTVMHGRSPVFLVLALVGAFLSALYMARIVFLVFLVKPKEHDGHVHEAKLVMTGPLMLLVVLAIGAGFLAPGWGGVYEGFGSFLFHGEPEPFKLNIPLAAISTALVVTAFFMCWLAYVKGAISTQKLVQNFRWVHRLWVNKYYMDDIYQWCINRIVLVVSGLVAIFDRAVVNDKAVNGPANSVRLSGFKLRYQQTGKVYNYAFGMVLGVVALALVWWLLVPMI